ncbi:MAG: Holliday junction resolvase RuvX [Bacillales bacterium]|nr:Holliday junction resolvase RuvX [Bacillales bacterium]
MRYLGLDLGTKTLGLSLSDVTGTIASTYKVIRFNENDFDILLPQIKEIVLKEGVGELVLGLPKNMNNTIGDRALVTIEFKEKLENYLNMKVNLMDERLSTVSAHNYMISADMSRKKRKEKVDALAANIILQSYLDKKGK